jgi:hypothetical protein
MNKQSSRVALVLSSLIALQSFSMAQAADFHKDIIYQVFTDRFFNGRKDNDNPPQSPGLFDPSRKNWKAYWAAISLGLKKSSLISKV